eukprot:15435697-Alexandrium_andersonii.AAC.1
MIGRPMREIEWKCVCLPQRMGGCGVQSAEARLAASVWAGPTAALKQALPVVPQGVERLVE